MLPESRLSHPSRFYCETKGPFLLMPSDLSAEVQFMFPSGASFQLGLSRVAGTRPPADIIPGCCKGSIYFRRHHHHHRQRPTGQPHATSINALTEMPFTSLDPRRCPCQRAGAPWVLVGVLVTGDIGGRPWRLTAFFTTEFLGNTWFVCYSSNSPVCCGSGL